LTNNYLECQDKGHWDLPAERWNMSKVGNGRKGLFEAVELKMKEISGLNILYSQTVAARLGVNSTDLECLELVAFGSEVTAGALAKRTGLTTGSITTAIDRLERAGFVQRGRDNSDRRKVVVSATPAARLQDELSAAPMREVIGQVLERYENSELAFLARALSEMCDAAKQVIANGGAQGSKGVSRKAR
jgi:DNA-binding MarR family transcriptional regulator